MRLTLLFEDTTGIVTDIVKSFMATMKANFDKMLSHDHYKYEPDRCPHLILFWLPTDHPQYSDIKPDKGHVILLNVRGHARPDTPGVTFKVFKGSDVQDVSGAYSRTMFDIKTNMAIVSIWFTASDGPGIMGQLNQLLPDIKAALSHELEHQRGPEVGRFKSSYGTPEHKLEYMTNPGEVQSFVVGLMQKAKTARRSFADVVNEYLALVAEHGFSKWVDRTYIDQIIAKIKHAWTIYAVKRYGKSKRLNS